MLWLLLMKLASAIVSVALGAGILARDHSLRANRLIAGFLFCNAWWACGEFALHQESNPESAATIFRLMSIGWMPLGVLCMHASLTLSKMEEHPVGKLLAPLYVSLALLVPIAMTTDFVILGAEAHSIGWRPLYSPGMLPAYLVLATPVIAILFCWRGVMEIPDSSGQLQLARIVFFGISGSLAAGTLSAVVLPLMGGAAIGITTTLVALVGLATTWTLHQFGHSLISPQALAREILNTLSDGVVLLDERGMLRDVNRAFAEMVNARATDVVGRPVTDWIPRFPENAGSEDSSTFMEVRTKDGETIPVVASAAVDLRGSGRFVGRAFLLRDRREIVSLQRRLVVSARLAAVGDLSKSISNSINEPIARTRDELEGLAADWKTIEQNLERRLVDPPCQEAIEEGHELIEECVEGVDRISSIVREISGFSSESSREHFEPHRLDKIVDRALRIARIQAPAWLEIEAHLDADVQVQCHAAEIERVVTNLLVNAVQAFEMDRRAVGHLVVAVGAKDDRALIHVEDDGCGIDPEVLDRIFDPFFTTKPVGKGTGLGLPISYHIVKDHGGDIRVSSIPDRGTSVSVDLPRVAPIEPDED